jgi:hypothetical protein
VRRRSNAGKNRLHLTRCAVDIEAELHHSLNHILNLFIGGVVLHGDDHHGIPLYILLEFCPA